MKDRLEEYVDGLLDEEERREVEALLDRDGGLRAELERVRRFAGVMEGLETDEEAVRHAVRRARVLERRATWIRRLAVASVGAAAVLVVAIVWPRPDPGDVAAFAEMKRHSLAFGRRLGAIAEERRQGRVPRTGVGDLEVPPAYAYGIVFEGALEELGVTLTATEARSVKDLVKSHYVEERRWGRSLAAECKRAEASLVLYRKLEEAAGPAIADAYYDVFRPGLADLDTARRVRRGQLAMVVDDHERYLAAWEAAIAELNRRYGETNVDAVLEHVAPRDRRARWFDAAQEGVGRDIVLAIRAHLYHAACGAGVEKLYVEG